MGFIRRFCTASAAIIFTFVLAIQAFAVSIDGSVSPDEVRGTNVQIQCENENGGNGICALATYYTKTEKGSLYVAINGDISYADLTKESPVVYEIYVDGKDPIKISITGKAEYDEQLFSVKSSASFAGGGITCEALIDRKYSFGGDPEQITIAGQSAGAGSVLTQMTCPDNFGLFQRAVIMSGMIRSPYAEEGMGIPPSLDEAEKLGEKFFDYLGVKTLAEARQLDAKYIRDCYDKFMYENEIMVTSRDNNICIGDPIRLFAQGKYAGVPVLAGNTEDEFPFVIDAQNEEELEKKASAWFCKKAEEFLAIPQVHEQTKDGYAPVSGMELMTKAAFLLNEKSVKPANCYYYRFAPDIPGEDHPGTFHSVDLWFFFETLAKCWRPFVGRHYDLARQMCNYWANFIKYGDPNGTDDDGKVLPKWNPYQENDRAEMVFTAQGAKSGNEKNSKLMEFLLSDRIERMK